MTIVLFPGRMNPPHLGHIITILKLREKHGTVIVAVIDDEFDGKKPNLISVNKVIDVLNDVFRHISGISVINGGKPFRLRKNFSDLPVFDIVVSGSMDVLDNCRSNGLRCEYCKRTPVFRGEHIREAYKKGITDIV